MRCDIDGNELRLIMLGFRSSVWETPGETRMDDVRDTVPDDAGLSAVELGGRDGVRDVGRDGADESAVGTRSNSSPSNTERMVPPSSLPAVGRATVGDSLLVLCGS